MPSIWETAVPDRPDWRRYQERLEAVRTARYNFDLDTDRELTESDGWHLDHYDADLPPEPPGPPLPDTDARASFAVARDLIRNYAFPDPKLVTGIFSPDEPVEGRPMLLRARFLAFTFWFGVRVGRVLEGAVEVEGDRVHVATATTTPPSRATLSAVRSRSRCKRTRRTGAVSFVIDAFSKPDHGSVTRSIGLASSYLVGSLQVQFSESACERMQRFVQPGARGARRRATTLPLTATPSRPKPVSKDAGRQSESSS